MKNEIFYDIIDNEINKLKPTFKKNEHLQKQDENGQKSFLFLIWFLKRYLPNCEISELEKFITEGNDDSSCDLIFSNTDQEGKEIYYVVQAKWFSKKNINKSNELSKEIKSCLTDFRIILSGKKESEVNKNFNIQYEKFLKHKRKNGKVKFLFLALCNGDVNLKEHIDDFISNLISFDLLDFNSLKQQYIELEFKGIKTHNPIETPYIPKSEFELKFEKNQVIYVDKPFKSNIFIIKPSQIYLMFDKFGQSLFYKNIRNPLTSSHFNEEIKNTVKNNPINFWYFNNGITAITDRIDDFHSDSDIVTINGIQVINGAQTVYSIYDSYKYADDETRKKMDHNALITFRVLESGGDDFDLKVTRYTNSQNPISERDFHANDEIQLNIQKEFLKNTNVWYETRRGEFRKKIKGVSVITNETFGQLYLAYFINDPFNAKQNRKLIFVSNKIKNNGLYEIIFNNETKYDNMYVAYLLHLLIDRKRKAIKSIIDKIDTNNLKNNEQDYLKYDFIQYANFEILALFKILLLHTNENANSINGKLITYFENNTLDKVEKQYQYISDFILSDLEKRKKDDSKIVNSVLFKSKEYYKSLKKDSEHSLITNKNNTSKLKL